MDISTTASAATPAKNPNPNSEKGGAGDGCKRTSTSTGTSGGTEGSLGVGFNIINNASDFGARGRVAKRTGPRVSVNKRDPQLAGVDAYGDAGPDGPVSIFGKARPRPQAPPHQTAQALLEEQVEMHDGSTAGHKMMRLMARADEVVAGHAASAPRWPAHAGAAGSLQQDPWVQAHMPIVPITSLRAERNARGGIESIEFDREKFLGFLSAHSWAVLRLP